MVLANEMRPFCTARASKDELHCAASVLFTLFAKETSFPDREGGKTNKRWGNASPVSGRDWRVEQSSRQVQQVHNTRKGGILEIGKNEAEHGPEKAVCHCSKLLGKQVLETTA